jgi:hypothetical protein
MTSIQRFLLGCVAYPYAAARELFFGGPQGREAEHQGLMMLTTGILLFVGIWFHPTTWWPWWGWLIAYLVAGTYFSLMWRTRWGYHLF